MASSETRAAAGIGAIGLAVITLLGSAQFLDFMRWVLGELKVVAALPLFWAVAVAVFVGATVPAVLPYFLPNTWPRACTMRVTRGLASGTAGVMIVSQYPSAVGVQYALFAASGSYVLWTIASNFVYSRWPHLKPPSLVDEDVFCERVRMLALVEGRRAALRDVARWGDEFGEQGTRVATAARDELADR